MRLLTPLSALLLALPLSAHAWDRCSESRELTRQLPTAGVELLDLSARAGDLKIEGSSRGDIRLTARLCSNEADALARMDVVDERDGDTLRISAQIPWDEDNFDPRYAYIDLHLQVPEQLLIDLRDSSGDIDIRRAAIRRLQDSSGAIELEDGRTDLTLLDTSGEIRIKRHRGSVTITDSSGDMHAEDIHGEVRVLSDSSGDIDFRKVSGAVTIDRDSSGDIDIHDVASVRIGSDSSGSIDVRHVRGDVEIDEDSSGNIDVTTVAGNFRVGRKGQGSIRSTDVTGEISVP